MEKMKMTDNWEPEGHRIYKFLKAHVLLKFEWCFCRMVYLDYSLKAHVKGLVYVGWVCIKKNNCNDTYILLMLDEQGNETRRIDNIKKNVLVITLRANLDGEGDTWERIKQIHLNKKK